MLLTPILPLTLAARSRRGGDYGQHTGGWRAFRSDNYDPRTQDGRFDLRAHVDGEAVFFLREGEVRFRTLTGRPPVDAGSEYRKEIPRGELYGIRLDQRDGRGSMWIEEEPSRRNDWTMVVRVSDPKGGEDRYHARITWEADRQNRGRGRGRDWRDGYYREDDYRRR